MCSGTRAQGSGTPTVQNSSAIRRQSACADTQAASTCLKDIAISPTYDDLTIWHSASPVQACLASPSRPRPCDPNNEGNGTNAQLTVKQPVVVLRMQAHQARTPRTQRGASSAPKSGAPQPAIIPHAIPPLLCRGLRQAYAPRSESAGGSNSKDVAQPLPSASPPPLATAGRLKTPARTASPLTVRQLVPRPEHLPHRA